MLKRLSLPTFAFVLACSTATFSHAQTSNYGKDFTSVIYQVGDTHFLPGDSIVIDSIVGTESTIKPGNLYEVKGHYVLHSHANAELALNVTSKSRNAAPSTGMQVQHVDVSEGEGTFTVYTYLWDEGYPHLSFYPVGGGSSFSAIYFGNGPTLMPAHQPVRDVNGAMGR